MRVEHLILGSVLRSEELSRKIVPYLKQGYFRDQTDRLVYRLIDGYIRRYNAVPSKDALLVELMNGDGLGSDQLDLLYLHALDPAIPIEETAGALADLLKEGKTRAVGASNCSVDLLPRFSAICPLSACQMHFNMLQREIEAEILPWCRARGVAMIVYWPLMKGLLAGGMTRDQVFPTTDSRHKYPMFNGEEFQRNLDVVDRLKMVAARLACPVADVVLAWTAEQPGITSVLFGATSPMQAVTNAQALHCVLDDNARQTIAAAVQARGPVAGRRAV